ncbi:hypothetical protein IE53DRAFT_386970 [Violaceomyces palustris]|uniref:Uncharacterized protein n=1 Tax=Violaceomyces palustris TaxID=1673888 RepID=A0ACD0NYA3_9BASI|nr:hypothetical protein IE53DRAFT_386970 [Violaceomyces palustris]
MSSGKTESQAPSTNQGGASQPQGFVDPTDDPTFQSLRRLLQAPASSNQHLSLLSTSTLYGSISYYIAHLETVHTQEFIHILVNSACLWSPPSPVASSSQIAGHESRVVQETSLQSFLLSRASSISQVVASSVPRRVKLLLDSRSGSTGWTTRRLLSSWLTALISGLSSPLPLPAPSAAEPYSLVSHLQIPRLAILSGLLTGFHFLREERKSAKRLGSKKPSAGSSSSDSSHHLNLKFYISQLEDEWIVAFAEILEALQGPIAVNSNPLEETKSEPNADTGESQHGFEDEWEKEFKKRSMSRPDSRHQIEADSSELDSEGRRNLRALRDVPLFLAAQVGPSIPDRKMQALCSEQLVSLVSDAILDLFECEVEATSDQPLPSGSSLLSRLPGETWIGSDGKAQIRIDGETVQNADLLNKSTLFPLIGPLSRILSRALGRATMAKDPASLLHFLLGTEENSLDRPTGKTKAVLARMSDVAKDLENGWIHSCLAGLEEDKISDQAKQHTKQLWTIFKTILFSYTMVFETLIDSVVEMCPSPTLTFPPSSTPSLSERVHSEAAVEGRQGSKSLVKRWGSASTSNLPPAYIEVAQSILITFSHLYWITSTFGSDGFETYRKVFYSTLDVIARDGEGCVRLLESISPLTGSDYSKFEMNQAKRSCTTYFLNVSEQLTAVLPDDMIEGMLLPICRPYLEDTRFKETFESAHSVILSLYSNKKACITELAPYYVELLIKSFPKMLNPTQLEYAMVTIMNSLSEKDDSVAWWVVDRLSNEIEAERKSPMQEERFLPLKLCLIALIPTVNLVLLRSLLRKVERYILDHKEEEQAKIKVNLCEKAFDSLSGLNSANREEGLRWWLDKRTRFGV